jgi:hypothetical protein
MAECWGEFLTLRHWHGKDNYLSVLEGGIVVDEVA